MNLNAIAASAVAVVHPWSPATYQQSTGYTTAGSGHRAPTYADGVTVSVQKQPLTFKELAQVEGLNLVGEKCAFYVDGDWRAVSRPDARGGDLITLQDGRKWLVVQPLENWHDEAGWCKVAAVLQGAA